MVETLSNTCPSIHGLEQDAVFPGKIFMGDMKEEPMLRGPC